MPPGEQKKTIGNRPCPLDAPVHTTKCHQRLNLILQYMLPNAMQEAIAQLDPPFRVTWHTQTFWATSVTRTQTISAMPVILPISRYIPRYTCLLPQTPRFESPCHLIRPIKLCLDGAAHL